MSKNVKLFSCFAVFLFFLVVARNESNFQTWIGQINFYTSVKLRQSEAACSWASHYFFLFLILFIKSALPQDTRLKHSCFKKVNSLSTSTRVLFKYTQLMERKKGKKATTFLGDGMAQSLRSRVLPSSSGFDSLHSQDLP